MQDIKQINKTSPQDINALKNLNYQKLTCEIDFKDLVVNKPWGYEYLLFENEFCAIWILKINYMQNTSMHCHPKKATSLICLDAKVSCNTLNDSYRLKTLDGIFLEKEVFHQTQSISKEGSFILEIETPVNKFDLVRIDDTYGRQGKEYEDKNNYQKKKGLTLNSLDKTTSKINHTEICLVNILEKNQLDRYDENSIICILSSSEYCGKIFRIKELPIKLNLINTLILLVLNEGSL